MQPMPLLLTTCINLRHVIVETSEGTEEAYNSRDVSRMVIERAKFVWEEGLKILIR